MATQKNSGKKIILALSCLMTLLSGLAERGGATSPGFPVGSAMVMNPGTEETEGADRTLSPYFFVKSDSPDLDQLPLKATSVQVHIAGVIADVKVTQIYRNEGRRPIEAIYVFPASTKAAVCGMKMTIGERTITAMLRTRNEARQIYEQAKQEGKTSSLLEQQRPNVFQMNVANVLPGDEIRTELNYTELMSPGDGVYEFVYPTVVGPRYSNKPSAAAASSEKWVQNPYLHEGNPPTYTFDLSLELATGVPIAEVACTSHEVAVAYENPTRAKVALGAKEKLGGNRDFVLKYRLAGERIESGLLLYEGAEENFFLLMMQPPKRIAETDIPPREYIFIVDVSGSMHGFPLEISKRLLKDLISRLRPSDTFNVLLFSGGSQLMAEQSLPATDQNIRHAIGVIERQQGGGGTELLPALKRALALPRKEGTARSIVIVTDGYVTVETEAFDLIRKEMGRANFFAFGIGSSVNRFLIEGMARAGAGEPFIVTKPDEAAAKADKFRQVLQSPVLTRIELEFKGFDVYDLEPAGVPDLFADRPVTVFGKWRGAPKGSITLRGVGGKEPYSRTLELPAVTPLSSNSALRYLWARSRIAALGDYNTLSQDDKRIKEITDLGLKYNLLTAYTSFVAVDSVVRAKDGEVTTVQQPLPLPEGVSDYAVGGATRQAAMAPLSAVGSKPAPSSQGTAERYVGKTSEVKEESSKARDEARGGSATNVGLELVIDKITVVGALPEEDARKIVEEHRAEIEQCLGSAPKETPPEGLVVRWTVDSRGRPHSVKILSPQSLARGISRCIIRQIKAWHFSLPAGSGVTTVTVELTPLI